MNQAQRDILWQLASDSGEYETEYAGRMYTFCKHCEVNLEDQDHESDCLIMQAQEALGSEWTDYVHKQEQEQQERQRKRDEEIARAERQEQARLRAVAFANRKVECGLCGATVSHSGLEQHQASVRCERRRAGVSRSEARKHGFATCKQCGVGMPSAHPNKKFCSNTGFGNCKDRYHNARPERAQAALSRLSTTFDLDWSDQDDYDYEQGWDAHKDTF